LRSEFDTRLSVASKGIELTHLHNYRPTENLWERAVAALSDKDKQDVDFDRTDKLAILADVLNAVDKKKQLCIDNCWKYRYGNREIMIRDQLEKVAQWVKKFVAVGDAAAQYDPGHAALPWAGVRFLLQVSLISRMRCECMKLKISP
jgi:hypothetical protein